MIFRDVLRRGTLGSVAALVAFGVACSRDFETRTVVPIEGSATAAVSNEQVSSPTPTQTLNETIELAIHLPLLLLLHTLQHPLLNLHLHPHLQPPSRLQIQPLQHQRPL